MDRRYIGGAAALLIMIPGGARAQDVAEREITLIGCVMREAEYRDMYGPGRSGPRGPGLGGRNEYVLVDAREVGPGAPAIVDATAACPPTPGAFPTAYELTGSREEEVGAFLGRRVEVTGIQKEASARPVGTSGIPRPTGGFDPLGHELHLFEVELGSVAIARAALPPQATREPAAQVVPQPAEPLAPAPERAAVVQAPVAKTTIAAPPVPDTTIATVTPAPEVAERPLPAEPRPNAQAAIPQAQLPATASPLALAALLACVSLVGAAGVRVLRRRWFAAALCIVAVPAAAAAQQTPAPLAGEAEPFPIESHWLASGSLGSDFEADAEDPGVNFAGTIGWLWHGMIGGELQSNFSPDFELDPALAPPFLAEEPTVNSYMLNAIGALPFMAGGQFQPYVSGGAGWFMLSADPTHGDDGIDLDDTQTGWNAGVGVMGFLGQLGVRADLRHFSVLGDEFGGVDGIVLRARHGVVVDDQEPSVDAPFLAGASFWRGNVGVALRW